MGAGFPTWAENTSQKNVRKALLFCEALPQLAAGKMMAAVRAVFLAPFGRTAIVFIVKEVVFRFLPVDHPSQSFTHVPLVLINGMAVFSNLPFIKI